MTAIPVGTLIEAVADKGRSSGAFVATLTHEPKACPSTSGYTLALWFDTLNPVPKWSGGAATTMRIAIQGRIYTGMLTEPQDKIDTDIAQAVCDLFDAICGDFRLGGAVRQVDLLGAYGEALTAKAGYLNQDGTLYRVVDLNIPLIANEEFTEAS